MCTDLPNNREFSSTHTSNLSPWELFSYSFLLWLEHEVFGTIDDIFEIDFFHRLSDIFSDMFGVPALDRYSETRYIRYIDGVHRVIEEPYSKCEKSYDHESEKYDSNSRRK